jgi:imidazolonepropionase-like amidohydrolase
MVDLIEKKEGTFALVDIGVSGAASTYLHLREALKGYDVPYVLKAYNQEPASSWQVGTDLNLVAEQMAENEEVVLTTPNLNRMPNTINRSNLPNALALAGATVGFVPQSDSASSLEAMRFQVGEVIKGGMDRAQALEALWLNTAKAVGLDDRIGSIETGKDANLVMLSGDPLDIQSVVERVLIEGVVAYERDAD